MSAIATTMDDGASATRIIHSMRHFAMQPRGVQSDHRLVRSLHTPKIAFAFKARICRVLHCKLLKSREAGNSDEAKRNSGERSRIAARSLSSGGASRRPVGASMRTTTSEIIQLSPLGSFCHFPFARHGRT